MNSLFKKISAALFVLSLSVSTQAQFVNPQSVYIPVNRPSGLNWMTLKTDHFRVIYPEGFDSLAYRTGLILEQQYPLTKELAGGELKSFPVIMTTYNDLSNGFVTPINFRSEFDAAPFKGKSLNPQSGDWLETVVPHELLHAVHGNVTVPGSIASVFGFFSPDFARTFNFFPPFGVHEGLAVHHESENVYDGGGRQNYTYFNNQFRASVAGNEPWTAGQIFQISSYQLPGNRHYISGSNFTHWLHEQYGEDVSKKAIRFHNKFFFMGYGFALRHVTGKWPGQLYQEFITEQKREEALRQEEIGTSTSELQTFIETPYRGVLQRKPIWISDTEILFYSIHYNAPRGFYLYDTVSKKTRLKAEVFTVSDYNVDYSRETNQLLFSEYDSDLIYPSTFRAEIQQLQVESGKQKEITKSDRVYSPTFSGETIIALQTNGASADVVQIDEYGNKKVLTTFTDATPISVKANPDSPDQIAIIINRRGVQALWITTPESIDQDVLRDPRVAFEKGSITDLDWHPSGQKLLFTADATPAMNIYELNLSNGDIIQKTNSLFNVFEASYSPDGSSIAYVVQEDQEQKIAILEEEDFYNQRLSEDALLSGVDLKNELNRPLLGSTFSEAAASWTKESYGSDFSWLKPRVVLPVIREKAGTSQAGVSIQSIDALSSQSYSMEFTGIQSRLWYDINYTNKTFWPGFRLRAYSDPSFGVIRYNDGTEDRLLSVMLQERGYRLSIPTNIYFNQTTRGKSLFISPSITVEQFRYFDLTPNEISDFSSQYKAGIFSQLNWNILTRRRDIQPVAGISVFGFVDKALNDPDVVIDAGNGVRLSSRFNDRWATYYGVIGYIAPLQKLNQSMRIDLQFLNQSEQLLYNTSTIRPESFTTNAFAGVQNLGRFSTNYVIPVAYPGEGGMLVPFNLKAIYLSAFSHTLTDLNQSDLLAGSRSVFGGGLHFQFDFSNINLDIGFGFSIEPTRNEAKFLFGEF